MPIAHRDESFLSLGPHGFHRVAYTDWGAESCQHIVICVHGMTRNSRDFDALAGALAGSCRVASMDVVGRGRSDWLTDPSDYAFPVYLHDAATLIALLSARPSGPPVMRLVHRLTGRDQPRFIDWVGTSMGGLIGMMLAAKANSPIRRLVLNDVGPFVAWQAFTNLKSMHTGKTHFQSLAEVESHLRNVCAEFGPLTDEQWRSVAENSAEAAEDGGYILAWDPAIVSMTGRQHGVEFGSGLLYGVDLWPTWNAVRCPTLVLRGENSGVLSAATAATMRESAPHIRVVEIPGVGHAPWLMSPDQIALVRDFLLEPDRGGEMRETK
jgi:pimeloyl-ACP methyl ester carboxylesterase